MSKDTPQNASSTSISLPNSTLGITNPVYEEDEQLENSASAENCFLSKQVSKDRSFTPISISWFNLEVSAKPPTKLFQKSPNEKQLIPIIKDVSGQVDNGHVLAILGASGAGKTTLLNVLTGRNLRSLVMDGKVLLNGKLSSRDTIKSCSAYVQQADLFIGVLTVREHLTFQAYLRTGKNLKKNEIVAKVDNILFELGLTKVENSRIGTPGISKSISGGEMKRLAFASEIITDPSILFCDEPTSGLDSYMAQSVVNVLKSMAKSDRTVICTIHQPSSEVFELFDELLLLAEGRVAFMGSSSEALSFFSKIQLKCPQNYNPADFYIQQLAIVPGKETQCREKVKMICDQFSTNEYGQRYRFESSSHNSDNQEVYFDKRQESVYKRGFLTQCSTLTRRSFLTNLREPLITSVRISQTIFVALLLGIVYWRQEYNQEGIMNINGALFILLANITFTNVFAVINTFCLELPIFVREHNNGLYAVTSYFLSKLIAELPYFIFLPILFSTISYWMIGLYDDWNTFLIATGVFILIANVASGFGYFISCLSKSVTMGLSLAPPFLIPLMLFGGLFINNASIPNYLAWIKYISWFYYGNEILVVNQWRNVENITCNYLEKISNDTIAEHFNLTDPNLDVSKLLDTQLVEVVRNTSIPDCTLNGQGVIKKLNFSEDNIDRNLIMIGVLVVSLRVFAYLALSLRARLLR